jgi:hypothetical protein
MNQNRLREIAKWKRLAIPKDCDTDRILTELMHAVWNKKVKQVVRTIRKGHVSISGVKYFPDETHAVYDGRLDGKSFVFGLYDWQSIFVSCIGEVSQDGKTMLGPPYSEAVDGKLPWQFWSEKCQSQT